MNEEIIKELEQIEANEQTVIFEMAKAVEARDQQRIKGLQELFERLRRQKRDLEKPK